MNTETRGTTVPPKCNSRAIGPNNPSRQNDRVVGARPNERGPDDCPGLHRGVRDCGFLESDRIGRHYPLVPLPVQRHFSSLPMPHERPSPPPAALPISGRFLPWNRAPSRDCRYFFLRSTTHSQCASPRTMFLVSLNVNSGFKLSATPSPKL